MSDHDQLDVLVSVYLIPELAQQDFDAFVKLAEEGTISTDGVVLVTKDAEGEVTVQETGDHLGRKGVKVGGGVGRAEARTGRDRREDGHSAATRLVGDHRNLRPRRRRCGRRRTRKLHPLVDRPDRQGLGKGAQGGSRGGFGGALRLRR